MQVIQSAAVTGVNFFVQIFLSYTTIQCQRLVLLAHIQAIILTTHLVHTHDRGPDVPSVKSCTMVPLILLSESGISSS